MGQIGHLIPASGITFQNALYEAQPMKMGVRSFLGETLHLIDVRRQIRVFYARYDGRLRPNAV
jgi:hypothetical protein